MVKFLSIFSLVLGMGVVAKGQTVAPEVWASAGDFYKSASMSVTWTMGETVIETYAEPNENLILTQGFNQPTKLLTAIAEHPQNISPIFSVYPNPTSGILRIKLSKPYDRQVEVSLFNTLGQLIQSESWLPNSAASELEISLENLANGVYFLQISSGEASLGVYKVQKDNR